MDAIPILKEVVLHHPVDGYPIGSLFDIRNANAFVHGAVLNDLYQHLSDDIGSQVEHMDDPLAFAMGVIVGGALIGGGSFYDIEVSYEDLATKDAVVSGKMLLVIPSLPEAVQAIQYGINGYEVEAVDPTSPIQRIIFNLKV